MDNFEHIKIPNDVGARSFDWRTQVADVVSRRIKFAPQKLRHDLFGKGDTPSIWRDGNTVLVQIGRREELVAAQRRLRSTGSPFPMLMGSPSLFTFKGVVGGMLSNCDLDPKIGGCVNLEGRNSLLLSRNNISYRDRFGGKIDYKISCILAACVDDGEDVELEIPDMLDDLLAKVISGSRHKSDLN